MSEQVLQQQPIHPSRYVLMILLIMLNSHHFIGRCCYGACLLLFLMDMTWLFTGLHYPC